MVALKSRTESAFFETEADPPACPANRIMREIVLIGLSHKTAPVELRECLALSREEASRVLEILNSSPALGEVMLFSTCNRVEILFTADDRETGVKTVKETLSELKQTPISRFEVCFYIHSGEDAVRHVFRVAASLDSMMVGEPQILGQIKDAYQEATQKKATGVILNRLLHKSFFVAKRVRSETGIGDHAVSISYAAIELGRKIFGSLAGKSVLLVGAGEMAELAVEHLIRNRIGGLWVANRTFARGLELAGRFGGKAIRFEEITEYLKSVDVIISSTGSPGYVISSDQVKQILRLRRNRPLFFIDIAVPRDIDPEINRIPNSFVYDIDDLKGVIEENIEDRQKEAIKGERIVDEAVLSFRQWLESLDVVPTIVGLRSKLEAIARSELQKTTQSLPHLSAEDAKAISRMTCAMLNKMLHDPIQFLKQNGATEDGAACLNLVRKLFKLDRG